MHKDNNLSDQRTHSKHKALKTRTMYFRIPERLHEAITREAAQIGLSITDIVRRIFEDRYQIHLINEHPPKGDAS